MFGKKPRGFSLIEVVVAMGLFAIVAGIAVSILFTSLRVSKNSDVLITIKEQGDAAMSQIIRQIRFAKSLDVPASCTPTSTTNAITITSPTDNAQTTFVCSVGASSAITSNSASLIDTNAVTVTSCSFVCSQTASSQAPTVTLQFTLSAKNATNIVETKGTIPFQSSVTLRNVNQ